MHPEELEDVLLASRRSTAEGTSARWTSHASAAGNWAHLSEQGTRTPTAWVVWPVAFGSRPRVCAIGNALKDSDYIGEQRYYRVLDMPLAMDTTDMPFHRLYDLIYSLRCPSVFAPCALMNTSNSYVSPEGSSSSGDFLKYCANFETRSK